MKRIAIASLLCVLVSVAVFAGSYLDIEQFFAPPGALGDLEARVGVDFTELIGEGFVVSGDLYYSDASLWLWGAPGKDSEVGLSFSLRTPRNEEPNILERWQLDIAATTGLHSKVPHHFFRPEGSGVALTLSALLGNWTLFVRATSTIDYDPFLWDLVPSFGFHIRS